MKRCTFNTKHLTSSRSAVSLICPLFTAIRVACVIALLTSLAHAGNSLYADNYLGIGGAYSTIQGAVNAAGAGDTVWVSGHFDEQVLLNNKDNLQIKKYPGAIAVIDGDEIRDYGIKMVNCDYTSVSDVFIQDCKLFALDLEGGNKHCDFIDCTFQNTVGTGGVLNGSGVRVRGGVTDDIAFTRCIAHNNALDGFSMNSESPSNHMTNIWLTDCEATSNGRQGLWVQYTDVLRVYGGGYNGNCASGIQLEKGTIDVEIVGVVASNNSTTCFGEAGIWVDESVEVDIGGCVCENNQYGILVSQSEDVLIYSCQMKNARNRTYRAGLNVNGGQKNSLYLSTPQYTGQPYGGVRSLSVTNCTFSNNGPRDIWYGHTRSITSLEDPETEQPKMKFFDNTQSSNGSFDLEDVEFLNPAAGVREYFNGSLVATTP